MQALTRTFVWVLNKLAYIIFFIIIVQSKGCQFVGTTSNCNAEYSDLIWYAMQNVPRIHKDA